MNLRDFAVRHSGRIALAVYAVIWIAGALLLFGCATGPCDLACHDRNTRAAEDAAAMVQHRVDHMDYPAADDCAFKPGGCR